jgi:hypothetical protein
LDKGIQNCFVRLNTLKCGVCDAVMYLNDGAANRNVGNMLDMKPVNALKRIGIERIRKAEIAIEHLKRSKEKEKGTK